MKVLIAILLLGVFSNALSDVRVVQAQKQIENRNEVAIYRFEYPEFYCGSDTAIVIKEGIVPWYIGYLGACKTPNKMITFNLNGGCPKKVIMEKSYEDYPDTTFPGKDWFEVETVIFEKNPLLYNFNSFAMGRPYKVRFIVMSSGRPCNGFHSGITTGMIAFPQYIFYDYAQEYPSDFFQRLFYPFLLAIASLFAFNWLLDKFCSLIYREFEYGQITIWQATGIIIYIIIVNLLW